MINNKGDDQGIRQQLKKKLDILHCLGRMSTWSLRNRRMVLEMKVRSILRTQLCYKNFVEYDMGAID